MPRCLLLLAAALSVLVLHGCSSAPERGLSRKPVRYASLPNGHDPLNPDQPLPRYTAAHINVAEGYRFRTVAIPQGVDIGHNALAFDPKQMRAAFDAGLVLGRNQDPWSPSPAFVKDLPSWALDLVRAPR